MTTLCACGHPDFDHHAGRGRCVEPSKRCRCLGFRECRHETMQPWQDNRMFCTVCGHVEDAPADDLHDAAFRAGLWQTIEQRAKELKDAAKAELSALQPGDAVSGRYGDKTIAKASMTAGRTRLVVTDEAKLVDWVKRNYPTEITETVNKAFLSQVEDTAKRLGQPIDGAGELVPGVQLEQGQPYVSVRRTPDALAIVGFLLSEGLLTLDGVRSVEQ